MTLFARRQDGIEERNFQNKSFPLFLDRGPPFPMSQVLEMPMRGFSTQNIHTDNVIHVGKQSIH